MITGYSSAVDGVRELVRLLYHFLCVDDASNVKRMRTSSGDRVNMSRFSERVCHLSIMNNVGCLTQKLKWLALYSVDFELADLYDLYCVFADN